MEQLYEKRHCRHLSNDYQTKTQVVEMEQLYEKRHCRHLSND